MIPRSSTVAVLGALMLTAATPVLASQTDRPAHHAAVRVDNAGGRTHASGQSAGGAQQKISTAQSARRPLVSVGPQAMAFQRIRALAMAPTG